MPTYDYRCKDCEHQFQIQQRMTDEVLSECPECSGTLKRLIGAGAGLLFKGSGFYITDYRSDGYQKAAEKDKKPPKPKSDSAGKSKKAESKSPKNKPAD
jgi:putative FmdB family regulatory protein